jgi:pimeloyl-ACP methyl ester carboxylesterase
MAFVTSKDGTRIGYGVVGSGPAIVLVDGALCWRASGPAGPLAEQLKDRFTVYTYDRRGRGESGDTKPFATQREVEDLDAVLDAAGGSAVIYAISSGVAVALAAANTASVGSKITKMVLYELPIMVDDSRKHLPDPGYADEMDRLIAAGDNAGAVKHFMKDGIGIPAFGIFMMQLMGIMKKLAPVGPTLAYDTAFVAPFWNGKPIPKGTWSNVTMPVLAIGGGKSDAWMQNAQVAISKALPNASHKTLPGQNHMVAATAIAPMIRDFVSERERLAA